MIVVRSFLANAPFEQIEQRTLDGGSLTIGRDSACDWRLPNPDGKISRHHCTLTYENGVLTVLDLSTNGVRIGRDHLAAPQREPFGIAVGEAIYLGEYLFTTDVADEGESDRAADATGSSGARAEITQAELLASFCEGAGLEPGAYAGQDALIVMSRLGAVYRQVIDDLCEMLRDRADFKADARLDRTTVGGWKNNPFKWAPPARIAVDLVKDNSGGFVKGAEAIAESFSDLRAHSAALAAIGMRAGPGGLDTLSPSQVRDALGPDATTEEILAETEARIAQVLQAFATGGDDLGEAYKQALKAGER